MEAEIGVSRWDVDGDWVVDAGIICDFINKKSKLLMVAHGREYLSRMQQK